MTTVAANASIHVVASRIVVGCWPHWQQPLSLIEIAVATGAACAHKPQALHAWLHTAMPALVLPPPVAYAQSAAEALGHYLLTCMQALLDHQLFPLLVPPQLKVMQGTAATHLQLCIPNFGLMHTAVNAAAELLCRVLQTDEPPPALKQQLAEILQALAAQRPHTGVATRLLQAATATGVPWLHVSQNVYQFGWGCHAVLFDGAFTSNTPTLGVRMARLKYAAAQVLRQSGLPVPVHALASTEQQAAQLATRLGFPVVVKPADLDGGVGVTAHLTTAAAVAAAWRDARAHSERILVEKYIVGRDYRVIVLNGSIISVAERRAATLVGDGVHSVEALLATLNQDPLRQPAAQRRKQVALDAEALALLAEQHMQLTSIPAAGQQVPLRRTANIARGGTAEFLTLTDIHPDNRLLCIRAAAALRLDLAGIDLLMPDIRQSWHAVGGAICEVNAQPEMQPDLPPRVLQQLVPGQGRIPVVVIVADPAAPAWWQHSEAALQPTHCIGVADSLSLRIGGNAVTARPPASAAQAAQILLREAALQAAVFIITAEDQLRDGAPVDRIDLLVTDTATPPHWLSTLLARSNEHWCSRASLAALQKSGLQPVPQAKMAATLAKAVAAFIGKRL